MSADPQPLIATRKPFLIEALPPGEYRWCACGRSQSQPFCDGSHSGTGIEPMPFTVKRNTGTLWLCGCKHTRHPPHCDGAHNRLPPVSQP
ncbi:MAG TPA: CDGSH iron-sulfur domain-containing protein [Solimonas sp.]